MDKRVPPPLPPKGNGDTEGGKQQNLPSAPKNPVLQADPTRPAPQQPSEGLKAEVVDIDYEVKKKSNPWLWIVPGIIILLLAGGGVYAYYYIKDKEEKQRKELQAEKEAAEAEEAARQKAIADSIAEVERIQAMNDSLRVNFRTPDLDMLGLKGHVKSIHTKVGYTEGNYDVLCMLLNETTIDYDYDGSFSNLGGNLNRYGNSRPSIGRNSEGKVNEVVYHNDYNTDTYTFNWNGDYLSSVKDSSDGSVWNQTNSGGSYSNPASSTFTYHDSDNTYRVSVSFTYSYSDFDEYGNWRKATVSATGTRIYESEEWDEYYEVWNRRTNRDDLNYNYTIERFINYHEYQSVE